MTTQAPRVNRKIRIPQVRLIDVDGTQVGVLATSEALTMAEQKGLDLVEVSPKARPPVCRIMDYGKYMYQLNKRAKEARKRQHTTQIKEIKMRPKIEPHDYDFKLRHAREFLEGGDKVKCTVTFRGREMAHKELGIRLMNKVAEDLADTASVEVPISAEGRAMMMVLALRPGLKVREHSRSDEHAEGQDTSGSSEEVQAHGVGEDQKG